jgi:hypothetical protein
VREVRLVPSHRPPEAAQGHYTPVQAHKKRHPPRKISHAVAAKQCQRAARSYSSPAEQKDMPQTMSGDWHELQGRQTGSIGLEMLNLVTICVALDTK